MIEQDTVKLLRECNAGIKMGVQSIDDLLPKAEDDRLKDTLSQSKQEHEKLGNQTHELLNEFHDEGKEPHPVAKGMSWDENEHENGDGGNRSYHCRFDHRRM